MRLVSFCAACEKRRPWADRGTTYWRRSGGRVGVTCARKSQQRAQRCAARLNKLCMRLRHACVRRQVSREQEGLRAYAELQRKHRDAYGDNEEAREAAGKAALLRAKALHSPGWAARLRCEERGRLAAKKWVCRSWLPHTLPHSVRTGFPHTPTQGNTAALKRRQGKAHARQVR